MSRLRKTRWTLVQHSKYAAQADETFRNAVEPAGLTTHQQLGEVIDAGGLVFDAYPKVEDAADEVSQPAMDRHLYPDQVTDGSRPAPLRFAEALTVDGRAVYLPPNGSDGE